MALNKTMKRWIIIISIPVALVIIGAVALKLYLTGDRLKALVVPRIEETTHRKVTVGDVSLSLFPTFGISVEGVKMSNPRGVKFEKDEFLSLDKLVLDVKIFALLQSRLEIDEIILDHPRLYIEVTKEGAKNYATPSASEETDTAKIVLKTDGGGALLLSNLRIRGGEVEYVDRKGNSYAVVTGYNQTARAEIPSGENSIHVETEISADKLSYGTLSTFYLKELPAKMSGRFTYNADRDVFIIDSLLVQLKDLALSARGNITSTQTVPTLDLVVAAPHLEMKSILSLVPAELLKASKGLNSSGDVKFSLIIKGEAGKTTTPGVTGSFTLTNGTVQYTSLPKKITNINVTGTFEKPPSANGVQSIGQFAVEKFSANLGSSEISGNLKVSNFDDPQVAAKFSGTVNLNEVKEYYPVEQGTDLTGTMNANVSIEGKAKVPASMKAGGQIGFSNVTIKTAASPKPLRDLTGTIAFTNQVVESKKLLMNIGESDLNLSFVMKNYLSMVLDDAKSSGKPSATVNLLSKVLRTADLTPDASAPAGTAKEKETEKQGGMIPGFNIDANVSIDRLVTEKFEFTNARGAIGLSNGVATLRNFSVNVFQGTVVTRGMLDTRDPKKRPFDLDLQISGVEANAFLPKFTSFGKSLFGKLTMNTKIRGDLNDTLGMNTQTLAGNGTVQVFDGKLVGLAVAGKLAEVTGLSELGQINFKNWANAFEIVNGRVAIEDLRINAGATDFLVAGSQGLDGSLDYNLTAKLPSAVSDRLRLPGIGGEILQFFKDKDGRFNLSFQVGGTATSPSVKIDTKAQEDMAKKALEQKATDELKKKLNEGLKKLFKKD